jgi:DNA-directed RNA polymerase II subunit RPB2
VGVIYDIPLKELRLFTDYGRTSRPLFIVDNQRLLITKKDIVALQVGLRRWYRSTLLWPVGAWGHMDTRGPKDGGLGDGVNDLLHAPGNLSSDCMA